MSNLVIDGDVQSSADVERQFGNTTSAFAQLVNSNQLAMDNLRRENVEGPALDLLAQIQDAYATLAAAAKQRACRFAGHVTKQQDLIAANPDLAKTYYGTWLDPRRS